MGTTTRTAGGAGRSTETGGIEKSCLSSQGTTAASWPYVFDTQHADLWARVSKYGSTYGRTRSRPRRGTIP